MRVTPLTSSKCVSHLFDETIHRTCVCGGMPTLAHTHSNSLNRGFGILDRHEAQDHMVSLARNSHSTDDRPFSDDTDDHAN